MALNVPDVGENIVLENFVNKTAPQNPVLRLYVNNITPADSDTAATYTQASFSGYAQITLTGSSWNSASGGAISYGSQQTFTASGSASEDVYGYYVVQASSGTLMWSERDASAPFAVRLTGDAIRLTPALTAS